MRGDADVVKKLAEVHGLTVARDWQRAAYVEVDGPRVRALGDFGEDSDVCGSPTLPLPWDDVIFCVLRPDNRKWFARINKRRPDVEPHPDNWPPEDSVYAYAQIPAMDGSLLLACTYFDSETKTPMIQALATTDEVPGEAHYQPCVVAFGIATKVITHITSSSRHMTEIQAASPRCSPKTAKLKPWLRDDLPRIILLDPTEAARTYEMPTRTIEERRAPVPHGRRGHWRRLRAKGTEPPRRTWVRPMWIGPTEWESSGQIYRVLG